MTTLFITKYALTTTGILKVEGEINKIFPNMCSYKVRDYTQYAHADEWYLNREDAVKRAEEMRLKKIASLRKQLSTFEKMEIK